MQQIHIKRIAYPDNARYNGAVTAVLFEIEGLKSLTGAETATVAVTRCFRTDNIRRFTAESFIK